MVGDPAADPRSPVPGATGTPARVLSVAASAGHRFSKQTRPMIRLVAGLGVEGDGHLGETVQHRSRVRRDPTQPNLRQVHLIASELLEELRTAGHVVAPGDLGENVTTGGIDVLALPIGTVLRLGATVELVVTGLRNPCVQIDRFQPGLLKQVLSRDASGDVVRRAGIMTVVRRGGEVRPGDGIVVELPPEPHRPLEPV
jgi:MOSC domain-containing protein YiiM